MLGYWENRCLREYTPGVEESVFDKQALDQGSSYIKDHAGRLPVVLLARLGRIWEVFRPVQNVELNEFFEQRGHQASWATLIGYYVMVPFAIGGLVVLRRRRIPIYPFLAIVVAISLTVMLGFPVTRYRAVVRRGHAGARGGRARRPVAILAASPGVRTPTEAPVDLAAGERTGRGRGVTATTETRRTDSVDTSTSRATPARPAPTPARLVRGSGSVAPPGSAW